MSVADLGNTVFVNGRVDNRKLQRNDEGRATAVVVIATPHVSYGKDVSLECLFQGSLHRIPYTTFEAGAEVQVAGVVCGSISRLYLKVSYARAVTKMSARPTDMYQVQALRERLGGLCDPDFMLGCAEHNDWHPCGTLWNEVTSNGLAWRVGESTPLYAAESRRVEFKELQGKLGCVAVSRRLPAVVLVLLVAIVKRRLTACHAERHQQEKI